jgi:hypothetical protein
VLRLAGAALALALALAACGGRSAPDDAAFQAALEAGRNGAEVTFDATLTAAPQRVGDHEHLLVRAATGQRLEVDHNLSLAAWVPARAGDAVVVHGQLYLDPSGPGVHCTHAHTSRGCPQPGWIELGSAYYE